MRQFVVPQFIDVEDKIIGPISTRQFVMIIIGGLIIFLTHRLFDTALFLLTALVVSGAVALFGFYKVNGRPFHIFLLNIVQTFRKPRVRVWSKSAETHEWLTQSVTVPKKQEKPGSYKIRLRSRLAELALIVDTGGMFKPEE